MIATPLASFFCLLFFGTRGRCFRLGLASFPALNWASSPPLPRRAMSIGIDGSLGRGNGGFRRREKRSERRPISSLARRLSFWLLRLALLSLAELCSRPKAISSPMFSRPSSPKPPFQMPALAALGAVHSAYVVLLRSLISLAIFLSVACSVDRVFKVAVHLKHKLREMLTGKRPEHDFSCRPLPDPASYALVFPKVSSS